MTIEKLIKYFSWLYFRHWERWELLIIVLICLVLLLLIIWQHRKGTTKNVFVNQIRERSPIIGVKLADNSSHIKIEDLKKDRPAALPKKHTEQKNAKRQLEKMNRQIQLLQLEINKHKQGKAHLEQQVTELKAANKILQKKAAIKNHVKQAEQYPKQQIIEMPAKNEQPESKIAKSNKTRQPSSRQPGELKVSKNQNKHKAIQSKEPNWMLREKTEQVKASKELKEQPLDIQKLKSLAALAKQIRGHRPQ